MELSIKLAHLWLESYEKRGLAPPEIRSQFESSVNRERLLRSHALRWKALADERAVDEDTSLGGYAATGASRMLPIPHTGWEALHRGGASALGAYKGHQYGKKHSPLPADELKRVFSPTSTKESPMRMRAQELLKGVDPSYAESVAHIPTGKGVPKPPPHPKQMELESLLTHLGTIPKEQIQSALHTKNAPRFSSMHVPVAPGAGETVGKIRGVLGAGGIEGLGREAENIIRTTAKLPKGELKPAISHFGTRGALVGAGLGALISGIPYAAKALYQKHFGGEAAERARGYARGDLDTANSLQQDREHLLSQLPAGR